MTCPICLGHSFVDYDQDKLRSYLQCSNCTLVFVPRNELMSLDEEKSRYDSHENSENDPEYIKYLSGIRDVILPHVSATDLGLDFGSGRTVLLENLFSEKGFQLKSYDLFFHNRTELLEEKYDYIIMSEVIEHLREPDEVMRKIASILNSGGNLFVKTKLLPLEKNEFSNWYYKRDKTHVQFFTHEAFLKFSELFGLKFIETLPGDLFLFRNN